MSDKPSPESAASSGSASNASVSSPKSRFASDDLVIRKQPPSHVFADEWFEIEVNLEHTTARGVGQGKSSETVVELVPTLRKPSGQAALAQDGSSLVTNPHTVRFPLSDTPPRRRKKIRCKISTEKPPRKDKATSYVIHLAPNTSSDPLVSNIAAVSTNTISIVNYKVDILSDTEWQPVWYKDEGGRDKAMVVTAGLVDKMNRPVTGEAVPLQLTLHYETEEYPIRVNNQDILRLVGDEQFIIDKGSGETAIKFRIEDVSKNHQGQGFVVEVAPSSEAKGCKDIGPGFTPAVSVRSKRNKRQRIAAGESRPQQRYSPARVHYPTGSFLPEPIPSQSAENPFVGTDIVRLRDAMKGVIQWTEEVVNGLYPLQWHVIGYAQHPDGSPDYTRPYHNMPNPNTCISRVLSMYSAETRDHLRTILNAVEAATPTHRRDDSYQSSTSSTAGSGLREPQEHFAMMQGGMLPGMPYPGLPVQSASAAGLLNHPGQLGHPLSFGSGPYQIGPMPQAATRGPPLPHRAMPGSAVAPPMGGPVGPASLPQDASTGIKAVQGGAASLPSPIQEGPEEDSHFDVESREVDVESREGEVAYVLARHFKSLQTGQRLGFPAYNLSKELLGFYSESSQGVGVGQFVSVSNYSDEFGPTQMTQSTQILEDAMSKKSQEVYSLKDWGSIASLIDHALVYAWSKDIDPIQGDSQASSGGSGAD